MTFSVNQTNQFYVWNSNSTVGYNDDGDIWVLSENAMGDKTRSDLITKNNILYAKKVEADDLKPAMKSVKVSLDAAYLVDGKPISGQDYILRIAFRQFVGMSDEDQYFKFGEVHVTPGMTEAEFYSKMEDSLNKNFSKEPGKLLEFSSDATGVTITEVEQEWRLGVKAVVPVYFEVYATPVILDGEEVVWASKDGGGIVTTTTPAATNGKLVADMEYFFMGERGDQYRSIGWPHNLVTKYAVDPTQDYDLYTIHYYYEGGNEGPQKSEKTVTIATEAGDTTFQSDMETAMGQAFEVKKIAGTP